MLTVITGPPCLPIRTITRAARRAAIAAAIGCHQQGARVWIIDGSPPRSRRQAYHVAGAQWVRLMASPAELHRRATAERPERWHDLIRAWFTQSEHGPS